MEGLDDLQFVGRRWEREPPRVRIWLETSDKVDLIRKRLLTAQIWQKRYADRQQRPLEFEVRDHIFLKMMPKK